MVHPRLTTCLDVVVAFEFHHWDERLNLHPIQVLMKSVEQDAKQLLRVLLVLIVELFLELRNHGLELRRGH